MRSSNTFREGGFGRRRLWRWAVAGFALACFVVPAFATDANRTLTQYLTDFWGPEKGFPADSVSSIAQTTDGYLWIGTDKGLVRFDGLNFRRFEPPSPGPFEIGAVRAVLADAGGNLWILLQNTRLFRYHNGTLELSRGQAEDGITAMTVGTSGEVLLSSVALGPLAYDGKQFRTTLPAARWPNDVDVAQATIPDDRSARFSWRYGNMPDRLTAGSSAVISIATTADGKIWLGTQNKGLLYLREGRVYTPAKELPNAKTNCLLPLQNSELWIGTNKGMWHWNGNELTRAGVPSSLLDVEVLSMVRDRDSNVWVGTNRGLFRLSGMGGSFSVTAVPTTGGPVTALFEDREGNLWVGSGRGIERLRRGTFITYSGSGLPSESGGPVYVDPEGRTWFGPIAGGLHWLKGEEHGSVTGQGLDQDVAYSIAGSGEELWIGWQGSGLTRLQYVHGTTKIQRYTEADGLPQNSIYSVYQGRDGAIWVGTLNGRVSKFDGRRFTTYTIGNTVTSILQMRDGTMWFGTSSGLSSLSNGVWRTFTARDGLPSEDVNCLFEDSSGTLWVGSSDGLAFFSSGHPQVPRNLPTLLGRQILGMAEDKFGWFWIATVNHVLRVQRDKIASGVLETSDLHEYGAEDGLPSTEGVKRSRSVISDPSGNIWFSLSRGLSVVDPSRLTNASAPAIAHIEALSADGTPIILQDGVHIPAAPKRITFTYTGLSLAVPDRVRFRYLLENFDRAWSYPVVTREAVYTNLPPGSYRFHVLASNSDRLWNGSETALGFEIEPLFWQTWWFRTTCLGLILLSAWGAHRYRLNQLTNRFNLRLEERVSERTRIARELHDTLLQSFHGLLLRFQTVSNLLPAGEPKQKLDDAIDQAAKAITEGRDAVQGLRSSTVVSNDLALAISTLGEELASGETNPNAAELEVEVEGTPQSLHPILRDEIYRIAGEAVRNAFKHAQAERIEVEIRYDERQLRVRVRDDGKGIDAKYLNEDERPGHYGLRGMRERAKLLGGKLAVWSELDSGTEVELRIPASRAYETSTGRRRSWLAEKLTGKLAEKDTDAKS